MSLKSSILASKWLVPVLTIAVIAGAIWGVVALSRVVGENLKPVKPRVIILGATWCGYCPSDEQCQKFADDFPCVDVEHLNIDEHPEYQKEFGTRVPRYILICPDVGTVQNFGTDKAACEKAIKEACERSYQHQVKQQPNYLFPRLHAFVARILGDDQ